jgi:hypothetical protein
MTINPCGCPPGQVRDLPYPKVLRRYVHRFSEPCRLMAKAALVYGVEVWRYRDEHFGLLATAVGHERQLVADALGPGLDAASLTRHYGDY